MTIRKVIVRVDEFQNSFDNYIERHVIFGNTDVCVCSPWAKKLGLDKGPGKYYVKFTKVRGKGRGKSTKAS